MAPYLYPYPTTGPVTFANVLLDRTGTYAGELAEATVARTRLHLALKAAAGNEPGSSALAVLEAVQVYLPYLRGIITCLDTDDLLFKAEPVFPWKPSLTNYTVSAPLLPLPSIHAEHHFVLLTYTIALSNYAHNILSQLPAFESSSSGIPKLRAEDEKRTTAALARAVDLLSQAVGVADWASANVSIPLEQARNDSGGRLAGKTKWPVETGPEAFRGLSMMLLADAHVTAIRKLLLPVLGHQLFAPPGPPLPSNHPSASLLGKLYLHVAGLYTSAGAMFTVHGVEESARLKMFRKSSEAADAADSDLTPELRRYLRKESLLSAALARKWLGIEAGEAKTQRLGEAIAWLKEARARLGELEDGKVAEKMKGLSLGKGAERRKEARKDRHGRVEREAADMDAWIATYSKLNDTVTFQPVPPPGSLTTPPGRPIFAAKAFTPPPPRLVPTDRPESESPNRAESTEERQQYAGQGNYF